MRKKLLIFVLIFVLFFSWSNIALAGFGISPPYVKNDHIIPGSSYEQIIYLLRSSAEDDLQANIEIEAPEIASWVTIDKGNSFVMPKGELKVPMIVKVIIPKNAEVGGYQGHINVKVTPSSNSGGVSVALGARVDIDLTLTNETYPDFVIRQVAIPDLEELGRPWNMWPLKYFFYRIKADMTIENTGNIKIKPSKVHLDVYDLYEKTLLESSSDTSLKKIDPFSKGEIRAAFPTNLPVGQYWGKVKIYKGDEVVNSYKLAFTIEPKGKLGNNGLGYWPIILVSFLAIVALAIIFSFIKFRAWRAIVLFVKFIFILLQAILGPFFRFIAKLAKSIKLKIFRWVLNKAKEHEKDKK